MELHKFQGLIGSRRVLTWTPDGKYLLFSENLKQGSAIWRIYPDGGESEKLWQSDKEYSSSVIHKIAQNPQY